MLQAVHIPPDVGIWRSPWQVVEFRKTSNVKRFPDVVFPLVSLQDVSGGLSRV